MTPEQIQELAAEIALEIHGEAFEGDKWLGLAKATDVVAAVLTERLKGEK